jgi:hypothetical protein
MRTVKKTKMHLLIIRERIAISQKIQQIWIQQAEAIFPMKKIPQKFGCTVKNNRKLSLLIISFRSKF